MADKNNNEENNNNNNEEKKEKTAAEMRKVRRESVSVDFRTVIVKLSALILACILLAN